MAKENGFLYVVATPIGNLDDISQRAISTLKQVDWIAAEDTRHTGRLLSHLGISAKTIALHDHNEKQRAASIIQKCLAGDSVALVSDAGTPLISDPGYSLVRQCRDAGVRVIPIPGPCALITALCAAGLPTDKFHFIGFLLPKSQQRQNQLSDVPAGVGTIICYDTARRVKDTLQDVTAVFGAERELVLAKELTKTFPSDRKYSFEQRGNTTVSVYSKEFCQEYHRRLNGMVERRLKAAILAVDPATLRIPVAHGAGSRHWYLVALGRRIGHFPRR